MQYRIRVQEHWGKYRPPYVIERKKFLLWCRIGSAWSAQDAKLKFSEAQELEALDSGLFDMTGEP